MIFANDAKGNRIVAAPGQRAVCPSCNGEVVAKCGKIKVWHWAHLSADCDPWSEGMTEWHIGWQNEFPEECREVVIQRNGEIHRADIMLPDGTVIEFQHSPISQDEIAKREEFYGAKMVWMFDLTEASAKRRFVLRTKGQYHTFRWKHPKLTLAYAKRHMYFDLDYGDLLYVRKIYETAPCGGWGYLVDVDSFRSNPTVVRNSIVERGSALESWVDMYSRQVNQHACFNVDPFKCAYELSEELHSSGAPIEVQSHLLTQFGIDVGITISWASVDTLRRIRSRT